MNPIPAPPQTPLRVLIADDEPLARELLRKMLEEQPHLEVVGECVDGEEVVEAFEACAPDLLFLDVQMPGKDGFEVLAALGTARPCAAIFVTAYDHYAVRAFEVNALDYVLKPFDEERLDEALRRARERLGRGDANVGQLMHRLAALIGGAERERAHLKRVAIKERDRAFFLTLTEVDWFEAAGKHVEVHVGREVHVARLALMQLERDLDPEQFVRISRSAIVNVDRIREVRPWFQGNHLVVLKTGAKLHTTRGFRGNLRTLFDT